jgi:acetolactate synthase-1/2/3 large subunit
MCVTREQLFYDDLYSYNRFRPSHLGAGLAAMFPGLPSVDVNDIGELRAALMTAVDADGPSIVSIECSPDEIPPFANFLGTAASKATDSKATGVNQYPITKENRRDVVARS